MQFDVKFICWIFQKDIPGFRLIFSNALTRWWKNVLLFWNFLFSSFLLKKYFVFLHFIKGHNWKKKPSNIKIKVREGPGHQKQENSLW